MSSATVINDQAQEYKKQAAEFAADMVQEGMIVGLGTGTTAVFLVQALGRRHREGLRFLGIPTSVATEKLALSLGIPLTSFAQHESVDLAIDGADEVERGTLNLIKGLGGALLREKIVAAASKKFIIVADESKLVDHLGEHTLVPVEATPFGWESTERHLGALGARVSPRRTPTGQFFVSDGGNLILDCNFGTISDPPAIEDAIRRVVGVVDSGLFTGLAAEAVICGPKGLAHLTVTGGASNV
ncbi:ribose-5-phosphate isomerase RpiA [Acetobacter oeni]|uniref:Ribose-5-phosphate isomerase A n=1 Tax=Acetobacter oeni TaxID=304077 RepID=A0A511XP10_9PROT|nr:ribose-5-phosphate isomerase RpiA [Acetobacter oeni]MBB3882618.1 ribose 5-phosphate isomerase A [Acetobacter oeni]NHO18722.1 ribose-5-phosphate isomerase RpiA [Acetobacter oeni]GBR08994.1 ribose 5-phosphate isomerase A [Acetobacter oeni LMG 21952]GEN64639.1 ribose-5-phosphate isomerase A [Acetobacter oeni]